MRALLMLLLALAASPAGASLVTFDVTAGGWDCGCGAPDGTNFTRETGLPVQHLATADEMSARFTIDTTAVANTSSPFGADWLFDQPGTGLAVTIGPLTFFEGPFHLSLGHISAWTINVYNDNLRIGFIAADQNGFVPGISEPTLDAFVSEPLTMYHGGSPATPAEGGFLRTPDWRLSYVTFGTIHRVPEPATPLLMVTGALALLWVRWRTRS